MSEDIWRLGAYETAKAIREGRISCREAVESAVGRMAAVNASVNAVTVDLSETALAAADIADAALEGKAAVGPLHGVPVTIKENVDQEGFSNSNGVAAFDDLIAADNNPVVDNLLRAGAITIGRTNTPEFSLRWFTNNPLRGKTLNPWDADLTPGGSSGGAASSVALGIGALALGSDLGGSLRYPAYACGIATIRPTIGRIPSFNASGGERPPTVSMMAVQGPMAREVKDVRLGLEVMAQRDPRDPMWVPAPLEGPRPPAPLKVAVSTDPAGITADPAVAAAVDEAAGHLADAGYDVHAVDPPLMEEIAETWRTLLFTDNKYMLEPAIREHGGPEIFNAYDGFVSRVDYPDLEQYIRLTAERTRLWRAWSLFMEEYPLVLLPVSSAPPFAQDEDQKGQERYSRIIDEQAVLYGVNLLALPAAAVPTGLHDGTPMGVQIVGQRYREDLCLDAAQAIENRVGVLAHKLWERG
jgi:amidase